MTAPAKERNHSEPFFWWCGRGGKQRALTDTHRQHVDSTDSFQVEIVFRFNVACFCLSCSCQMRFPIDGKAVRSDRDVHVGITRR